MGRISLSGLVRTKSRLKDVVGKHADQLLRSFLDRELGPRHESQNSKARLKPLRRDYLTVPLYRESGLSPNAFPRSTHLPSKRLQEELGCESMDRDAACQDIQKVHYKNKAVLRYPVREKMEALRLQTDDKLKNIEDKAQGATDEVVVLTTKISAMDEALITLEERLDSRRTGSGLMSLTPQLEDEKSIRVWPRVEKISREMPIRSESHNVEAWDVRVILVPSKNLQFAYSVDSIGYQRCKTRGFHKDVRLIDRASNTFVKCVESSFATIIRLRPWMPLQCLRSSDMSSCNNWALRPDQPIPVELRDARAAVPGTRQGTRRRRRLDAEQHEDLSWTEIRSLPRIFGIDERCWEVDEAPEASKEAAMGYKKDSDTPVHRETPSECNSPPPYSSRVYPGIPKFEPGQPRLRLTSSPARHRFERRDVQL